MAHELENNDMLNHFMLLAAVFYPEAWRASLFYKIRQLSFDEYSDYKLVD
jgi:hypothetical protein